MSSVFENQTMLTLHKLLRLLTPADPATICVSPRLAAELAHDIRAAIERERSKGDEAASRAQDYAIELQRMIETHCKGERVDGDKSPHLATLLNAYNAERDQLQAWKESALRVMPDYQRIGQLLGLPLGVSVTEHLIPALKKITAERDQLRKELADINTMRQEVLAGSCDPQNLQQHCNCVPWLREEIARLRNRTHEIQAEESKRNADLQSQVHKWEHYNRQAWERIGAERPFASRMEIAALLEDRDQLRAALKGCADALKDFLAAECSAERVEARPVAMQALAVANKLI